MRVLVACERSGRVRDALLRRGHDAISCDIEPSDAPGPHIQGRAETVLDRGWDMVIAFPPCTYLSTVASACQDGKCVHRCPPGWRRDMTIEGARVFRSFLDADCPRVAVENPQPHPLAAMLMGRHTAHTEPYWFGDPWRKFTCWWLRGLAPLIPTAKGEAIGELGWRLRREEHRPAP